MLHPLLFSRNAHVLAREATADDVYPLRVTSTHRAYVIESPRVRPVSGEHATAPRVALGLPDHAAKASALEA